LRGAPQRILACTVFTALPAAGAPAPLPSPEALHRIQSECLKAYPPDLLLDMTSGTMRALPESMERDASATFDVMSKNRDVTKGIFYPSLLQDILPALARHIRPGSKFLDLGSGDGRVVFLAGLLGAKAYGIEYEKNLVEISQKAGKSLEDLIDSKRIHLIQGDFFLQSWSDYDVIFYFDRGSSDRERLEGKIAAELRPEGRFLVSFEEAPFERLELDSQVPNVSIYRRVSPR